MRDASEKNIGKGYWICDVVGCEVGSKEITPQPQELWSQKAPDFRYYVLAEGIKASFKRIGKGPLYPRGYEKPSTPQLSLWSG